MRGPRARTASFITWRSTATRPVAIAALAVFEDLGYLFAAATRETDRQRGAQQALIARRIERAEQVGCPILVSETLSILEHSLRNLQRAGFREIYREGSLRMERLTGGLRRDGH